jgi:hypothetical protein
MLGWTASKTTGSITDGQLKACIELVVEVSHRAKNKEFKNRGVPDIRARMNDNRWTTWWCANSANDTIKACAFFQNLRYRTNAGVIPYAMCLGFHSSFTMATDGDCTTFLSTVVGGTAGDGLLWDCVKNVLNVPFVYLVDAPEKAVPAKYNARRNYLFGFMQSTPPAGANWKLTLDKPNDSNVTHPFWGHRVDLWQLAPQ